MTFKVAQFIIVTKFKLNQLTIQKKNTLLHVTIMIPYLYHQIKKDHSLRFRLFVRTYTKISRIINNYFITTLDYYWKLGK